VLRGLPCWPQSTSFRSTEGTANGTLGAIRLLLDGLRPFQWVIAKLGLAGISADLGLAIRTCFVFVPWAVKLLGLFVVAYALSPIDLIPDFIPILGYLDDVLLLPGLIWLGVHLLPNDVLIECRERADAWLLADKEKPRSYVGAVVIVLIWIVLAWLGWAWWRS